MVGFAPCGECVDYVAEAGKGSVDLFGLLERFALCA